MSRGKYSPAYKRGMQCCYNFYGNIPSEYVPGCDQFDEQVHMADYDSEGYDSYGYSGVDQDGKYVGCGNGIDRLGYTEMDYLSMSQDDWEDIVWRSW